MNSDPESEDVKTGEMLAKAPPIYLRSVAAVYFVLCAIGFSIAIHVYRHYPHPSYIQHVTKAPWSESIESYLFVGHGIMMICFLVLTYLGIFWQRTIRRSVKWQTSANANTRYLPSYYSVRLHIFVLVIFVAFGMLLLGLTIYRSWLITTGSV